MPPMDRDERGRCRKKSGPIAGQSLNAKDPPHDTPWTLRTEPERVAAYTELLRGAGYRGRPDAVREGIELYAAILGLGPLPSWVDITDFNAGR